MKQKIIIVHSFYRNSGGEDIVFQSECELLIEHGHRVIPWTRENSILDDTNGFVAFSKTIWNQNSYREFRNLLRKERPDIVHCHNTFGVVSPSIYYAAAAEQVPVVQTLHNYRYCCLNATFFRDGESCEDCVSRAVPLPGIFHRCYHNQIMASLGMCITSSIHRALRTWRRHISAYIALTPSARVRFIAANLPADRLFVKPNFVFDMGARENGAGDYVLFVGRLSEEKGIRNIVDAWEQMENIPLKIAGKGPLELIVKNRENIEYLGWVDRDNLGALIKESRFVILPSTCYEQFPMVIIDAFCCGIPVAASNHGAMADLIDDNVTGMKFEPNDRSSLIAVIRKMWLDKSLCNRMGENARKEYEMCFSPQENYKQLMHIYETVQEDTRSL